jgi:S1-C subfamily serine protease
MAQAMNLSSTKGALVSGVDAGSPAERAGVKQGDVITQFNGKDVADNHQLRNAVGNTLPGTRVPLTLLRDGRTETVNVTLGELAATTARSRRGGSGERGSEGRFGMTLESTADGVVVSQLDPSGIAAESGLLEGDVILKIDGKAVKSAAEVKAALDRKDGKPSLLVVGREDRTLFLTLRAE